jgi:dienelactone hydrolase
LTPGEGAGRPRGPRGPTARKLSLSVDGAKGRVPAIAWLPNGDTGPAPAVLLGHGGGMSKDSAFVDGLANRFAAVAGFTAVAIDLPYHGERSPAEEIGLSALERRARMGLDARRKRNSEATAEAVADWQATIDAVRKLDTVGDAPIGYFGLSMGTRFGIPFLAAERRVAAAVLGLFGYSAADGPAAFADAARQIEVPVLYLLQWDDELFPRADGLTLFDLLASKDKTLHANTGGHIQIPPAELKAAIEFLRRHLGSVSSFTAGGRESPPAGP